MKTRVTIVSGGGNTAGIEFSQETMDALGGGKRYPIVVGIGDHRYRTQVSWYRGAYMVPLSAANRAAAGVQVGDQVDIEVELDDAPRDVAMPDDLAAVVTAEAAAFFAGLSPSAQKAFTVWIEDAKKAETRAARVATSAEMLAARKKR